MRSRAHVCLHICGSSCILIRFGIYHSEFVCYQMSLLVRFHFAINLISRVCVCSQCQCQLIGLSHPTLGGTANMPSMIGATAGDGSMRAGPSFNMVLRSKVTGPGTEEVAIAYVTAHFEPPVPSGLNRFGLKSIWIGCKLLKLLSTRSTNTGTPYPCSCPEHLPQPYRERWRCSKVDGNLP